MVSPPHPPNSSQGRGPRHPLERIVMLLASLLDVHLRMALQEMSQDRRRLVGGVMLLGMAMGLLATSVLLGSGALVAWLVRGLGWGLVSALLLVGVVDLALAGILLRVANALLQGPYLVKTRAGLAKATRLIAGR